MRMKPQHIVVALVLVVIGVIVGVAMNSNTAGTKQRDGSVVSQTISAAEGNATASFVIALQEGGDAEHEAEHVFEAFQSPGIASVSLDTQSLALQVRYDDAATSESVIRKLLLGSGYLQPTAADATQATVSSDGKSQELTVQVGKGLDPSLIRAKAGIPLKMTFGPGTGHLSSISIAELGVQQDLATGAMVEIREPKPGTYPILCAEQAADGTLIIE